MLQSLDTGLEIVSMKLLSSKEHEELTAKAGQCETLSAENEQLRAKVAELESANAKHAENEAAFNQRIEEFNAKINELNAAVESAKAEAANAKVDAENQASMQFASLVASSGVPPVENVASKTDADIIAEFETIKDPLARARFIKEHGARMARHARNSENK